MRDLLKNGKSKILLNLGGVSYVDSSGIGELVSSYTTVTNAGGQLKLLNLTKKLRELLAITKLLTVFDTFTGRAKGAQQLLEFVRKPEWSIPGPLLIGSALERGATVGLPCPLGTLPP